jgi:hypothetical protein
LPSHALAGPPAAEVQPEPPNGRGLYGAGIFGVTFGILNIGYGIPLSIDGPGDAFFSGYIPIGFGASFIALGAVGIHYGKQRRKIWKAWKQNPTAPLLVIERHPKPPHVPWLIVGGVTTPLGIATMAAMIPTFTDPILNTPTFAYWVVGWGAVSTAAGIAMLTAGVVQLHRAKHGDHAWLELTPTSWAHREGFGLGVAGRF